MFITCLCVQQCSSRGKEEKKRKPVRIFRTDPVIGLKPIKNMKKKKNTGFHRKNALFIQEIWHLFHFSLPNTCTSVETLSPKKIEPFYKDSQHRRLVGRKPILALHQVRGIKAHTTLYYTTSNCLMGISVITLAI